MLVQCWASVADVGLTLEQRWVSVRWSSIKSYNQVTSSTTLYCILKAYTHASLEPDSIFNWGGWMLETPNWVPGVHDKVPPMISGAMPLLNPR